MKYCSIQGTLHDKIIEDAAGAKLFVANEILLCAIQNIILNSPDRSICGQLLRLQTCLSQLVCFYPVLLIWTSSCVCVGNGFSDAVNIFRGRSSELNRGIKSADSQKMSTHDRKSLESGRPLKLVLTLPRNLQHKRGKSVLSYEQSLHYQQCLCEL